MKKHAKFLSVVTVGLMVGCFGAVSAQAQDSPSPDFLAAALHQQEVASGSSLQAKYTVDALGPASVGNSHYEISYVRTPDALFMEEKLGRLTSEDGQWSLRETVRCRYDRAKGSYVELGTDASSGEKNARMSNTYSSRFTSEPMIDVAMFPISTSLLRERIEKGAVRTVQETVDQCACWRVDVQDIGLADGSLRVSVWVDPKIGFCPRQIVRTYVIDGKQDRVFTTRFKDYRELKSAVWFPMRGVVEYDDSGSIGIELKVVDVTTDTAVSSSEISVQIPSGTDVFLPQEGVRIVMP